MSYQLFKPAKVKLDIYNVQGILVRRLVDEYQNSGYYRIPWDGMTSGGVPVASGTYLGQFQVGDVRHAIRMQLVK